MNLSDYQKAALRTAAVSGREPAFRIAVAGMGLAGEASEALAVIAHGGSEWRSASEKELGDVMWYVAETASCFGLDLGAVPLEPSPKMPDLLDASIHLVVNAGGLTDYMKKLVGHGHEPDLDRVRRGLGLVVIYVGMCALLVGSDLATVCEKNIRKLELRHPNGFSTANSIQRADES